MEIEEDKNKNKTLGFGIYKRYKPKRAKDEFVCDQDGSYVNKTYCESFSYKRGCKFKKKCKAYNGYVE